MEKKITVAIYSGKIPSSIFIENLIKLIADKKIKIYLFGIGNKIDYNNVNIRTVLTPQKKMGKMFFVIYHLFQLIIRQPKKAFRLFKNHKIFSRSKSPFNSLSKILPVLNYTPDIFHIQWAKSLPFWFFLKSIFGVKIILSLRGSHINYSAIADPVLSKDYNDLFPLVDKMHAVSNKIVSKAERFGANYKNIQVIRSSLDLKKLNKFKKTVFETHKPFRFLSVGRFHWVKGYHYCLSAISQIKKMGKSVEYSIISEKNISEELLYQIYDLSIEKEVKILNPKSQDDVYRIMRDSDCLILSSIEEGISNVVLESMAIGLPVVSSDCGGMKEVIKDSITGFNFRTRDTGSLKNVLLKVIELGIDERQILSNSSRSFIQEDFLPEFIKAEFHKLYKVTMRANC